MLRHSVSRAMRFSPVTKNITKLLDIKSMKLLDNYCVYNPSPLTLKQLIEFGQTATEEDSFNYVKREVPIRLANIMKEINLLPSSLLQMPSMITLQVSQFNGLFIYKGLCVLHIKKPHDLEKQRFPLFNTCLTLKIY